MEPLIVVLLLFGVFSSETDPDEEKQPLAMEVPAVASGPAEQGSEAPVAVGDDYRRQSGCQVARHDVIYRDLSRSKRQPLTAGNADTSDCEGGCRYE
ncbi:hypothetical protein [Sedimenticola selenatireducens]|uniref:Uncharacterized protein n=1 Tax=Sedimenticola selenatireducens TaxID=191960 RepID=A0A2N6CW43_9GAMM|nr:hypothetical protein [Sedimenticola selenatireducens]PLX61438.1 MAG: hypothetical protein C0630_10955 [Sedimenticola selenatireducens]